MATIPIIDIKIVSEGSFLAKAFPIFGTDFDIPRYIIRKSDTQGELERFERANIQAIAHLEALQNESHIHPLKDFNEIIEFQIRALSNSTLIRMIKTRITDATLNAEAAIEDSISELLRRYRDMTDPYLAERAADIRSLGNRLLTIIQQGAERIPETVPENSIILADEVGPAEMIRLISKKTAGIIVKQCGGFSHTAILARASGIPLITYKNDGLRNVKYGDMIGFNAHKQTLFLFPDAQIRTEIETALLQKNILNTKPRKKKYSSPYKTKSGIIIHIHANIELPEEIDLALLYGAEGIGLLRTEFLFFQAEHRIPTEDEQYDILNNLTKKIENYPITIRTLDVGGDKIPPVLRPFFQEKHIGALGSRGIRFCLSELNLFIPHLRAILRASVNKNIRLLIPMITTENDMILVRTLITDVMKSLIQEKLLPENFELPPIGAMIEVPSAAICADIIAPYADFFAIGSNDLTQFTLVRDRSHNNEDDYFQKPTLAVLRLIENTVQAAQKANIPVRICGETPHFEVVQSLISKGIRDFSISPRNIEKFYTLLEAIM